MNSELNTIYYGVAHCTLCFVFGVLYFPVPPPIHQIGIRAWLDRRLDKISDCDKRASGVLVLLNGGGLLML